MEWTNIIVAIIAAAGGFFGCVLTNNKQLAIVQTKLDNLKEQLAQQSARIDAHNNFQNRIVALEVQMQELKK
jgi:uncharacterized membrane-anchored protein YhcB (DUF1043 family)